MLKSSLVQGFFAAVMGFGVVLGLITGLLAAVRAKERPKQPTWEDPLNVASHWRGWLKVAGALILVGVIGQVFLAIGG